MKLLVSEKQVQELMEYADKDKSGYIDFNEFKLGIERNW